MDARHPKGLTKPDQWITTGVAVVGFESPSCHPCREQIPIMKAVAERFKGAARVIDLNIEDNRELADRLVITSIPTLIIFKNGRELQRFVGLQRTEVLTRAIADVLGH
jgi:thioredoxin 1